MGTRGLTGYRMDGETIAMYNHSDSNPEGLGLDVLNLVRSIGVEGLRSYVDQLPKDQWQDDEFFDNRLSCQWAYFVNVDTNQFEIYCHRVFLRSYSLNNLPSDTEFLHHLDLDKSDKAQDIEDSWTTWFDQNNVGRHTARPGGVVHTAKQVVNYLRTGQLPID